MNKKKLILAGLFTLALGFSMHSIARAEVDGSDDDEDCSFTDSCRGGNKGGSGGKGGGGGGSECLDLRNSYYQTLAEREDKLKEIVEVSTQLKAARDLVAVLERECPPQTSTNPACLPLKEQQNILAALVAKFNSLTSEVTRLTMKAKDLLDRIAKCPAPGASGDNAMSVGNNPPLPPMPTFVIPPSIGGGSIIPMIAPPAPQPKPQPAPAPSPVPTATPPPIPGSCSAWVCGQNGNAFCANWIGSGTPPTKYCSDLPQQGSGGGYGGGSVIEGQQQRCSGFNFAHIACQGNGCIYDYGTQHCNANTSNCQQERVCNSEDSNGNGTDCSFQEVCH